MESDYETWQSLPAMFFAQAERHAKRPFLWRKADGRWRPLTWAEAALGVRRLAAGLAQQGLAPGDRVALVSENRPEWLIADMAIMSAGAITVPTFTTNTVADHRHILTHSQAKAAIVSGPAIARNFLPAALEAPDLSVIVAMDDLGLAQNPGIDVRRWSEVLAPASAFDPARAGELARDRVCCFIYTSGTGGTPKGVMLTHGSILCNCMGAYHVLADFGLADEVFLSFLPLSHSYEHTAGQFLPVSIGAQIYYAESVERLFDNMAETRPTIMTAVPRLYEIMHQRITRGVERAAPWRRKLFGAAVALGRRKHEEPGSLSFSERLLDVLAERLVRAKVRRRFGGRLKALVSGGAALNHDIGLFFAALGVPILQGYGQTEASPVISVNPPRRVKLSTVGPPMRGVALRIADDGEILVQGELVMQGYWRDAAATAEVIRDGWLHTGDIGRLDADGYLEITDRKKDIIVFSGGDNVSPARIEGFLVLQPEITQAMVYGDRHPHLVAALVPDPDFVAAWAERHGGRPELAELALDQEFHRALGAAVERVNARLSQVERVRRYIVAPAPFSIENAMLTPSLKIRRHKIKEAYGAELERLYDKSVL